MGNTSLADDHLPPQSDQEFVGNLPRGGGQDIAAALQLIVRGLARLQLWIRQGGDQAPPRHAWQSPTELTLPRAHHLRLHHLHREDPRPPLPALPHILPCRRSHPGGGSVVHVSNPGLLDVEEGSGSRQCCHTLPHRDWNLLGTSLLAMAFLALEEIGDTSLNNLEHHHNATHHNDSMEGVTEQVVSLLGELTTLSPP